MEIYTLNELAETCNLSVRDLIQREFKSPYYFSENNVAPYFVYCLEKNGVPFYVGSTLNMVERIRIHRLKYGKITFFILHSNGGRIDAKERFFFEFHFIWLFRSYGYTLKNKDLNNFNEIHRQKRVVNKTKRAIRLKVKN